MTAAAPDPVQTEEPTFDVDAALRRADLARLNSMRCQWSQLPASIRVGLRRAFETKLDNGKPIPNNHIADQLTAQGYPMDHQQIERHRKRTCSYCNRTGTE